MMSEKRESLLFLFRAFDFQIEFFDPAPRGPVGRLGIEVLGVI